MARAPVLFRETRLSPTPTSPSSILHINAAGNPTGAIFGAGRKRPFEEISGRDEDSFARAHLATEGSVFFRPKSKAPRSFLWRVLNDRHLLEVQSVDLVQERKHARSEGFLTFQITFPAAILKSGVALADQQEKDALDIFVLTSGNELYTITLKRNLLTRETAPTDFDATTCVKKYTPNSFSFRRPYRLVAISSSELFISLHDGGLMRLERQPSESGAQWRETYFSEGGWGGTLKGLLPFRRSHVVKYGNTEVDSNAITAIAKSPDGNYVWTVSLDHTLKAWSTQTGRVSYQTDLLLEQIDKDDRKRPPQYVMNAEQGTILQVVVPPAWPSEKSVAKIGQAGNYFLVVHSPKNHHFKFLSVSSTFSSIEGEGISLKDPHPEAKLTAPGAEMMNTNIWHLEHFSVIPGPQWQASRLWLRARSGTICKTFVLTFDLFDEKGNPSDLKELWRSGWSAVDESSLSIERLKELPEFTELDAGAYTTASCSEMWLEFLFYPGRFSQASLETALHIFRKGRGLTAVTANRAGTVEQTFKEQLVTSIAAKTGTRRPPQEKLDYNQYQIDNQAQWLTFFSLLSHLHKRRLDSIGFAYDVEENLPWALSADFIAPIRANSNFEILSLNANLIVDSTTTDDDEDFAARVVGSDDDLMFCQIIAIARQFRRYISAAAQEKLRSLAIWYALDHTEASQPANEALQSLYSECGLRGEVTDDEFRATNEMAEPFGGLGTLSVDHFLKVVERLEHTTAARGKHAGEELHRYGAKMSVEIAQDTLQATYATLLDILGLVVFMAADLEPEELHSEFRPWEVYEAIILRLKHTELRLWLVGHVRQEPKKPSQVQNEQQPELLTMTLYESMFIGDWDPRADKRDTELIDLLTLWSRRWTFFLDLKQGWDDITGHVMANLLKHKDIELAKDFTRFMSDLPWSLYLKGRLHMETANYDLASIAFKEAAETMAELTNPSGFKSGGLLSAEDVHYFGNGESKYFQHVSSLFEQLKVFSYTADFASMALESFKSDHNLDRSIVEVDMRKSKKDSPAGEQIENTIEEIRLLKVQETKEEILNRLFNSLVQTGRFEQAYETLLSVANPALQKSNLQILIQTCVKQDAVSTLLDLPIRGDLAQEADAILLTLAKKSLATGSSPPYHQIMFAFCTQHSNFRGAAAILYEHLERLRHSKNLAILDPEDDTLVQVYLLLINTLACCAENEGWLLADPMDGVHPVDAKRKLVTLEDIRREYSAELDKRSDMLQGRFPLNIGDEMDVL